MSADRGPGRRAGIALLGTAKDRDEAEAWQRHLVDSGIQSIVRGHRPDGSLERLPEFSGVDLYVPSSQLRKAREVLTPIAAPGQLPAEEERPFPWLWLFAVPVALLVGAIVVVVLFL